jgi:hypothetical protein
MEGQLVGKRVPWSQFEEYITVHQRAIGHYLDLEKIGWTRANIETNLPQSFLTIYQTVTKII